MTNRNNFPTELKDGSNSATQQISNTETTKQLEKDENTPVEKILALVGDFGNVKASAQWCQEGTETRVYWWGHSARHNGCTIARFKVDYGRFFEWLSAFANGACGWSSYFGVWWSVTCTVIINTLFGNWNNIQNELDWKASWCGGYATMYVTWAAYYWVDAC
jgi:hypothetical protein